MSAIFARCRALFVACLLVFSLTAVGCGGGGGEAKVRVMIDGRGLSPEDIQAVRIICLQVIGDGDGGTVDQTFGIGTAFSDGSYEFDYVPQKKSGILTITVIAKREDSTVVATKTIMVEIIPGEVPAMFSLGAEYLDGGVDGDVPVDAAVDARVDGAIPVDGAVDMDRDGYPVGMDCNDNNPMVNPGATEVCNSTDDDCDGQTDEGVKNTYYPDGDGDAYGARGGTTMQACLPPTGFVANDADCNDAERLVYPGAQEQCNGVDDDCDGTADDNVQTVAYYPDMDNDNFGSASATPVMACRAPVGHVTNHTDCNDGSAAVKPTATESCNNIDDDCDGDTDEGVLVTFYRDADSDTFGNGAVTSRACTAPAGFVASSTDCNDMSAAVRPNATETCNSVDDDCDGMTDEAVMTTYYRDADGDGAGATASTTQACSAPAGYVAAGGDCNDASAAVKPGATELCNGVDDDCSGGIDNGLTFVNYYPDGDSDNFGRSGAAATSACSPPAGYVTTNTDCNDMIATTYPGAPELCNTVDDNCNGMTDDGVTTASFYRDADSDGFGASNGTAMVSCSQPAGFVNNNRDCNDGAASVRPNATETCNTVDDDCDGSTDEGVQSTYYQDADGDTFGNASVTRLACTTPVGYVATATDCNDAAASVRPNATESCNLVDDNCNGTVDENVKSTFYRDQDGDTYGVSTMTTLACTAPAGYVANSTDCNDSLASIRPGAAETCNGIDDNCSGAADEGLTFTNYYIDADMDNYGSTGTTPISRCVQPAGYVSNNTDCNDASSSVRPNATEICNVVDDDCDGMVDENVKTTYYRDADADTYGLLNTTTQACSVPAGYASRSGDCDDTRSSVRPGATEICNGLDDNCSGATDEGVQTTYYRDADADTYGLSSSTMAACSAPAGYVANSTDCNDMDSKIRPNATESCNSVDDNCNGSTDEGVQTTYYRDADSDTYGAAASGTRAACTVPAGYSAVNTDCNDGNSAIRPGATEICNSTDDDCDGMTDEGAQTTFYRDADSDTFGAASSGTTAACSAPAGYVASNTDCNDGNSAVRPTATEICNSVDDDCDGSTDEGVQSTFYRDADSDTFGSASSGTRTACSAPAGYVASSSDCNDGNAAVRPNATETCNSVDDDCDGMTDEGVLNTYYRDADGDAYGAASSGTRTGCSAPAGYVVPSTDCNDGVVSINPGAAEVCWDNLDQNCSGVADEGCTADTCANAVDISESLDTTVNFTGASNNLNSLNWTANQCPVSGTSTGGAAPDLFYKFTLATTEHVYIALTSNKGLTSINAQLELYNIPVGASACGALTSSSYKFCDTNYSLRSCSQFHEGTYPIIDTPSGRLGGALAAGTYYLVVRSTNGAVGPWNLRFMHVPTGCIESSGGLLTNGNNTRAVDNMCIQSDTYNSTGDGASRLNGRDAGYLWLKCPQATVNATTCQPDSKGTNTALQMVMGSYKMSSPTAAVCSRLASAKEIGYNDDIGATTCSFNPQASYIASAGQGEGGLVYINVEAATPTCGTPGMGLLVQ